MSERSREHKSRAAIQLLPVNCDSSKMCIYFDCGFKQMNLSFFLVRYQCSQDVNVVVWCCLLLLSVGVSFQLPALTIFAKALNMISQMLRPRKTSAFRCVVRNIILEKFHVRIAMNMSYVCVLYTCA